jgi:pyridoxine kinase
MNILSIQSWVAYGHVGNAAAMFPLQRLGAEVWAIQTVQFSNHPGYGGWTGDVYTGQAITRLVDGIAARGVLGSCDAVLSGYLGSAATGEAVLQAMDRVRAANPAALYCCDPVLGDDGPGVYVAADIADLMRRRAVPQADILTPNRFELATLTGEPVDDLAGAIAAVAALRAAMRPEGRQIVLVTSLPDAADRDGSIDLLAADRTGAWLVRTPRLPQAFNGAGDAVAALFLFHHLAGAATPDALERAASSLYGVLAQTAASGHRELQLIAAQEELVRPTHLFYPVLLAKS